MKNTAKLFGLFSDETRLRILMLLARRELCVCQLMGVLGISQPLVSRNLALLSAAGLLEERREGKLVYYSLEKKMPSVERKTITLLMELTGPEAKFRADLKSLGDCEAFQKKAGRCDMKTLKAFMERHETDKRQTTGKEL